MRIKNWNKFQHFKDRKPPWIKLYRDLLDDVEWFSLDGESAKSLVMIWLVASENNGNLPELRALAWRLRLSEDEMERIVGELSHWLDDGENTETCDWPSRYISNEVKDAVSKRDDNTCQSCGSKKNLEFDHVVPVSKNGESTEGNLQMLCRSCNRKKRVCSTRYAGATQVRRPA
jgi:hypothetical protein